MIEVLIISAILLIYFLAIKHHRYWSDRHVETGKVIPIFGDSLYMALGKASMAETMEVMYNKLENKRYIGCYQFTSPVLVLKCPKLIQQIFIKDFDHVVNRKSFTPDSAGSLWNKSVLLLKGQDWKNMRSILSPLFTSSKMKSMFILICHNTNLFVQHFLNKEKESIDVDMKDAFTRFSMDLVATSTFGIQNDSLENRDNDFYKMGKHAADFATFRVKFVFFLYQLSQTISNCFGISMLCQEVEDYYRNLVEETIKIRSEKNIKRPDILGLLLESKIKKELDSKTNDSNEDNSEIQNIKQHLNNEEITSQLFIFLIAGFDTLTTTMCLLSYELAVNPDIQERLIEEIDRNRPLDGAPTYETIMNMTYLDMVISGQEWKNMRSILSPSFTGSKMKSMFILICNNANVFVQHFLNRKEETIKMDMKDALTRFTIDLAATSTFGIEVDSLKIPENNFYRMGRNAADVSTPRSQWIIFLHQLSTTISNYFGFSLATKEVDTYFRNLVKSTIRMRSEKKIKRPDMLELLLETQIKKPNGKKSDIMEKQNLSEEQIAPQLFMFLLASFEILSTTMCLMCYELACNPDVQEKLIEEIDRNRPTDDAPTYETIMNMMYLDMVISETLRKWPAVVTTDREVVRPLLIKPEAPGERALILVKGAVLQVPIYAIHHDAKYFENPEKFDPERFSPENRRKINPHTFIPFGVGPRNCIGLRQALMEMKTIFFYLLSDFNILPTNETQIPLKFDKSSIFFNSENGFPLALRRRRR